MKRECMAGRSHGMCKGPETRTTNPDQVKEEKRVGTPVLQAVAGHKAEEAGGEPQAGSQEKGPGPATRRVLERKGGVEEDPSSSAFPSCLPT